MYFIDIIWEVAKWAWEHRKIGLTWATASSLLLVIMDKMGRKLITNQLKRLFHVQDKSEFKTYVANQARIESKIDALLSAGGVVWDAHYLNGNQERSAMAGTVKNSSSSQVALWPVRFIVSFTRKKKEIFRLSGRYQKMTKDILSGKKKFLAFIIAVLINGLNDVLGLGLSVDTLDAATYIGGGLIAVEGILDIVRALSNHFLTKKQSEVKNNVDFEVPIEPRV